MKILLFAKFAKICKLNSNKKKKVEGISLKLLLLSLLEFFLKISYLIQVYILYTKI